MAKHYITKLAGWVNFDCEPIDLANKIPWCRTRCTCDCEAFYDLKRTEDGKTWQHLSSSPDDPGAEVHRHDDGGHLCSLQDWFDADEENGIPDNWPDVADGVKTEVVPVWHGEYYTFEVISEQ